MTDRPEKQHGGKQQKPAARAARPGSFWGKLGVVALIPIVFYSLSVVADQSLQTYQLRQQEAELRAQIEAERLENIRLQQELNEARSDRGVEEMARRHLNLIKPGDQAVVLTGAAPPPARTPTPAVVPRLAEELPPWLTWLRARLGR